MSGPITDPSERRAALKLWKALESATDETAQYQWRQIRKRMGPLTEAEKAFLRPDSRRRSDPLGWLTEEEALKLAAELEAEADLLGLPLLKIERRTYN